MNLSTQKLASLAQEMGLTSAEIIQRKKFLEFGLADAQLLSKLHEYIIEQSVDDFFTESFYNHLFSFPALREFLPDEATIHRAVSSTKCKKRSVMLLKIKCVWREQLRRTFEPERFTWTRVQFPRNRIQLFL